MISDTSQGVPNKQTVEEVFSVNSYLSMSFYLEKGGPDGFSNWMKRQSEEEVDHAYQMASYIIKRGGKAVVDQVPAVKQTWTSPLDAFEDAHKHKCRISHLIDKLLDEATEGSDKATRDLLWQFVCKQIEEEATAGGIVDHIRRMGDTAIFDPDQQHGSRMKQPLDM